MHFIARVCAVSALFACVSPALADGLDGRYAVRLKTESGACDSGMTATVGVRGGRIAESGLLMSTSGTVGADGRVALRVAGGGHTLAANGVLTANGGSGAWSSPTRQCSGRWVASRL